MSANAVASIVGTQRATLGCTATLRGAAGSGSSEAAPKRSAMPECSPEGK